MNLESIPLLSLRSTREGPVLCLAGRWRREFLKIPDLQTIAGVELSSFRGEFESSLEFLSELPPIKYFGSLFSFPYDYSRLYQLTGLRSLKFLTLRESTVDFQKFPHLESAIVPWHSGLNSVFGCAQLRSLSLFAYRAKTSRDLASLSAIEILRLKDCSLPELDALPGFKQLRRLEIGLLPKLTTLKPLADCPGLEWLRLAKCGRAAEYEVVKNLPALRGLLIDTDKVTDNLEFVESLSNLRIFNFALNVRDGNIRRLLTCPRLASAHYADRKHYNIRRDELNQLLKTNHPPISSDEEHAFRYINHGISDWQTLSGPERVLVPGAAG